LIHQFDDDDEFVQPHPALGAGLLTPAPRLDRRSSVSLAAGKPLVGKRRGQETRAERQPPHWCHIPTFLDRIIGAIQSLPNGQQAEVKKWLDANGIDP
jgi:hypothetical protein